MFSGVQHTGVIYFFKTTQTFDLLYFDFYSSCLSRYGVMSLYSEYFDFAEDASDPHFTAFLTFDTPSSIMSFPF